MASNPRCQSRYRRARATVLWGLIFAVAGHLGLALAIEYWLPALRDPYYAGKSVRLEHRLRAAACQAGRWCGKPAILNLSRSPSVAAPSPFTLVVLGSSRTAHGLQAGALEEPLAAVVREPVVAFNFGIPAAGPFSQLLTLKRLLADGIRPSLLLVEVLAPLLAGQDALPAEARWLAADRLRLPDLKVLEEQGFPVSQLRKDWWHSCLNPWYAHRFAIVSRLAPAWLPWNFQQDWGDGLDDSGWKEPIDPDPTPEGRRHAVEVARRQYTDLLRGFRLGGPTCRAQRELLDICRREHIPVALVLMPEGSEFRSWYPPRAWDEIDAFLDALMEEYGTPVINAREWLADEFFVDSHHLTLEGAAIFTQRMGQEGILPLLRQCPDPIPE
jgi:hypothetical protein